MGLLRKIYGKLDIPEGQEQYWIEMWILASVVSLEKGEIMIFAYFYSG